MSSIKTAALAVALLGTPLAAQAADAPLAKMHKPRIHHMTVIHRPAVHFGYYWYRWGWRWGGTRCCWYGASFAFDHPPW